MHQSPLFRRVTASLLACTLLASCSAPASDSDSGQKAAASQAGDASAAKVAAPQAQGGGRFAKQIQELATTKIVTCPAGFFPQDSATFATTSTADTTFNVPGGHALYLPAGAVPVGTQFVVKQALPDTAALDIRPIPATVQYDTLVSLTVNYAMCVPASDTTPKKLYLDENGDLKYAGGANRNKKVTAWLEHFSIYIVGGN